MMQLTTDRLVIRPCMPEDASDFIALERDPAVMRYLTGGRRVGEDLCGLDGTFLQPRGTEPFVWTILQAPDVFVGWVCLWPENETIAELGYRLRRETWGRGLAVEAAAALVDWGFSQASYDTIVASTMAANRASRRVLEKLGFRHQRTVSAAWAQAIPGSEWGEVFYAADRLVWQIPGS